MAQTDALSALFSVMSHPYRRVVLYYLREHERASVSTLADCVTGWFQAGPGADGGETDHESVTVKLTHVHLPKLADEGFATYDREAGTVTLAALPAVADDVLSASLAADAGGADPDRLLAPASETDGE